MRLLEQEARKNAHSFLWQLIQVRAQVVRTLGFSFSQRSCNSVQHQWHQRSESDADELHIYFCPLVFGEERPRAGIMYINYQYMLYTVGEWVLYVNRDRHMWTAVTVTPPVHFRKVTTIRLITPPIWKFLYSVSPQYKFGPKFQNSNGWLNRNFYLLFPNMAHPNLTKVLAPVACFSPILPVSPPVVKYLYGYLLHRRVLCRLAGVKLVQVLLAAIHSEIVQRQSLKILISYPWTLGWEDTWEQVRAAVIVEPEILAYSIFVTIFQINYNGIDTVLI
jgi:hypothetical protein